MQYDTCYSNHITESELRRITLDHLKKLYMAVKDDRDTLITQLGLNQLTELDKQIKDAENRVNSISRFLTELYEKKFQGKLSDSEFGIQSRALSCEKEELLHFLSDATAQKTTINNKRFLSIAEILNRIESYRLSELVCDCFSISTSGRYPTSDRATTLFFVVDLMSFI